MSGIYDIRYIAFIALGFSAKQAYRFILNCHHEKKPTTAN